MNHAAVIRSLITRTAADLVSYFDDPNLSAAADRIVKAAVGGSSSLAGERDMVESMLPDTEDDGRWETSYALNAGCMVLSLIDYLETQDEKHYRDAVTLFFDTVDFKVHQDLESSRVTSPSEEQIAAHPLFVEARAWFARVEAGTY